MRHLIFAGVAAALYIGAVLPGAHALGTSTTIRNPSAPLMSLDAESLIPILAQMDLHYDGVTLPSGHKALLVSTDDGVKFQITPLACDEDGRCRGMHFVSLFQTDIDERTVSAFNFRYSFASAGISSENVAHLTRYELADFGMPKGNVAVSIGVFIDNAILLAEHLENGPGELAQAPHASDLAANGLNLQSLINTIPAEAMPQATRPQTHALSFEVASDIVDTYVRAEAIYPGLIVNVLQD